MIRLEGKTRKAKNRLREIGEWWHIIRSSESVGFSQEKGPWLNVGPVACKHLCKDAPNCNHHRWIHAVNDPDFQIAEHK